MIMLTLALIVLVSIASSAPLARQERTRRARIEALVGAQANCPTPPLCDNRNTCLGGCRFSRVRTEALVGGDTGGN